MKKSIRCTAVSSTPCRHFTRRAAVSLILCSFLAAAAAHGSARAQEDAFIGGALAMTDIVITDTTPVFSDHSDMVPDTVYTIDLEGDGQREEIYYSTYTKEDTEQVMYNAVLEVYKNGQLCWSYTDPEWSYSWDMKKFTLADGKTYFLACSRTDNDWNTVVFLLAQLPGEDTLSVLADLNVLTTRTEEQSDLPLSGWSRIGYAQKFPTNGNIVSIPWLDTTKCTGNMTIYVDYAISENTVTLSDSVIRLEADRHWTAWHEFDVYQEAGSSEVLFHVSADEVVSLTEMKNINGQIYLKCINADGKEGWFPDASDYLYQEAAQSPTGYYQGYFKESVFAG